MGLREGIRPWRPLDPPMGNLIVKFYLFSQIKWRPVLWGLCLQLVLGIMVLRWKPGYDAVKFISEQLNKFLMYSLEGAAVVFGDPTLFLHPFIGIVSFPSSIKLDEWRIKGMWR